MAEARFEGRARLLRGGHIQSDAGADASGAANLHAIAQAFMETFGCDALST